MRVRVNMYTGMLTCEDMSRVGPSTSLNPSTVGEGVAAVDEYVRGLDVKDIPLSICLRSHSLDNQWPGINDGE